MPPTSQNALPEEGISSHNQNIKRASCKAVLTLAYQSLGVVYGDLSTSPLYVYKTTFSRKLCSHETDEQIYGVLSFIFWTFTIIPLFKYIFFVLSADDNGEGGTFALYSLLCRHARLGLLPNQQSDDEKLSAYGVEGTSVTRQSSMLKYFFSKHPKFAHGLLTVVLIGTSMTFGDGVLTPTISVLSAVSGVKVKITELHDSAETMFADLGHFSPFSIKIAFTFFVYPCLILAYMGEAAFLSKHHEDVQRSFYQTIPETVFWPFFIVATLASVVGSQAAISATFSIVSQSCALSCFPRVKIVHTSNKIYGQIYIPEINWILMCLCLAITVGLQDTSLIGHAYGLAVTTVMFVTSCLMSLIIILVWKQKTILAIGFLLFFGSIELLYISACLMKVPEGGWIPLVISMIFMGVMCVWNYGTLKKHEFDVENKVSVKRILASGPSLGMVRVPGIGLIYNDLVSGVPAIFGHFVTNLPAFHRVLVFVCVKSVQVPYVLEQERLLVGRVGPKEYGIFRCIVRYGYKDLQQEDYSFENRLVSGILEFVEMERDQPPSKSNSDPSYEIVISNAEVREQKLPIFPYPHHEENVHSLADIQVLKPEVGVLDNSVFSDETLEIIKAREVGLAYILGHSYAKAKRSSSLLKKFMINVVYDFLSKNCRGPEVVLNVPHTSLMEVGMIYYV